MTTQTQIFAGEIVKNDIIEIGGQLFRVTNETTNGKSFVKYVSLLLESFDPEFPDLDPFVANLTV